MKQPSAHSLHRSPTDGGDIFSAPGPIRLRWFLASAALAAEAIWLTSIYEAPQAALAAPLWQPVLTVFNRGYHYTAAGLFLPALLLIASSEIARTLNILTRQGNYLWWPWTALHGLALLIFAQATAQEFSAATAVPAWSVNGLAIWMAAGAATLLSWLFILAPPAVWLDVLRRQWPNLALAVAVAAVAWVGVLFAQSLWKPLAGGTLQLSALLLSLVYPEISYDPAQGLVGSAAFMVEIHPGCSGYEGIALVSGAVAIYLWIFRKGLSFPRAFVLFPIGIVSIWLANVLRVTALVVVGTSVSPAVASQGFHSQAGWIGFTLVTLGLIAIAHRWLSSVEADRRREASISGQPELALLVPLMALMATSMAIAATSAGFDALYPLGVLTTGAVLWHYRAAYRALFGAWSWEPFAIGAAVFLVWSLLVPGNTSEGQLIADRLAAWPMWLAAGWILLRALGAVATVPFAEELAFRGYLIRKLVSKDFERVRPGHFTWFSFATSSLLFGMLHQHLLAGVIAGAAFALALYRRGLTGDAIIAHATSNLLIALTVVSTGRWGLWA